MTPQADQLLRQQSRRLMRPGSFLQKIDDSYGLFVARNKAQKPVARLDAAMVKIWLRADLFIATGEKGQKLALSETGQAYLRRALANSDDDRYMAQHQLRGEAVAENKQVQKNCSRTALDWLQHRGRRSGLSAIEFEAGFRFQSNYEKSHFATRTGMDWSRMIYVDGASGNNDPDDVSVHILDARKNFAAAMAYLGPGLADIALSACCELQGLEACEARYGLPKRSGKALLKLALMRLSVHYRLQSSSAAAASFRMR